MSDVGQIPEEVEGTTASYPPPLHQRPDSKSKSKSKGKLPDGVSYDDDNVPVVTSTAERSTAPDPAPDPQPAPAPQTAAPQQPTAQIAQNLNDDHAMFEQDLARGKITPETYQSLYAKKDTLGKVGTLFGLLLSGAGSGLSHQPNAVLGMMKETIDNDLAAQKASNVNAQNWYQLTQKHEMQKAEIQKMVAESGLIGAQTGAIPSEIAKRQAETGLTAAQTGAIPSQIAKTQAETGYTQAQASMVPAQIKKIGAESRAMDAEAGIKTNTLAATRATGGAWQYLVDTTNKMPEGAAKEQAKQALGVLYPQYQGMVTDKNAQAAGMINYARMMSGAGGQTTQAGAAAPAVDYAKMTALQRQADMKVPGVPGMSSQDIGNATSEAAGVEKARALRKSFLKYYDQLDGMIAAGQLKPNMRQSYIDSIVPLMAKEGAGKYTESDAKSVMNAFIPEASDFLNPGTRAVKRQNGVDFFDNMEAGTPTLNRFNLKLPVQDQASPRDEKKPAAGASPAEKKPAAIVIPPDGTTGTYNGKKAIVRNRKWEYK